MRRLVLVLVMLMWGGVASGQYWVPYRGYRPAYRSAPSPQFHARVQAQQRMAAQRQMQKSPWQRGMERELDLMRMEMFRRWSDEQWRRSGAALR